MENALALTCCFFRSMSYVFHASLLYKTQYPYLPTEANNLKIDVFLRFSESSVLTIFSPNSPTPPPFLRCL